MADPMTYRPATGDIPTDPGVYRFSDDQGRVIYVGKAKNLRQRLTNYFQDLSQLHPRTQQMVTTASAVQWTVVGNEIEALTLEFTWIKEFNPRFNVMFKDDKSYPYLSVSLSEDFPRAQVTRQQRRPGVRYFGPYTHVWAIRETLELLLRVFPVRTCSAGVFRRAQSQKRPCLLGYLDKCSAPCVGRISQEEHADLARDLCDFMDGKARPFIRDLERRMKEASDEWNFEEAARLRDDIAALKTVLEKNSVVFEDAVDADIFALVADELNAAVHVFYVRGGRIRGTRGWVVDREDDASEAQLMARLIEQVYAEIPPAPERGGRRGVAKVGPASVDDVAHTPTNAIPQTVYVSVAPEGQAALSEWLGQLRGAKVRVSVPQRGQVRSLMETVSANAQHALTLYKVKRSGDLTERSRALEELADTLDLPTAPLRIECFDTSHTQGTHHVASMVVFEDGVPRKDAYRHFTVSTGEGEVLDDTAAMRQVLTRRFQRLHDEERARAADPRVVSGELPTGEVEVNATKPRRFSYRPDLLVVDGGLPQVNAARSVLDELGIDLPVVSLAKRLEEVWVPGDSFPVIFSRTSPALYLLQYLRDESHRFAIQAHRKKRSKAQTRSALDAIAGVGPSRQKALLAKFGSVKGIREASVDQLADVPGIGRALAATISETLNGGAASSSS